MRIDSIFRSRNFYGSPAACAHVWLPRLLGVCLLSCVFTGCRSADQLPEVPPIASATTPAPAASQSPRTAKKNPAARMPRLEAALKKTIVARLNSWKSSIETRDIEKHLQHYADRINTYYLASDVNHDFIRADRQRAFDQFDELQVQLINVEVSLETSDSAIITFDKNWNFRRAASFSNGLVQQEILMRKIEKQWFITSEKDLEIYRYQNN